MTSVTVTSTPFQVSVDDAGTSVTVSATGPAGQGVPAGGSNGQVLKKSGGTNYVTEWAAGGTGDLLASNNLSEVTAATARSNLGAAATNHNHAAGNITSGTLATDRIPDLAASKITSGTLAAARIPTLGTGDISGLGDSAVKDVGTASDEVAAGNDSRFTNARTPVAHSADLVTSGTLAVARGGTGVGAIPMVSVITAADAAAARSVLGVGTGVGDVVASNNLSDLANAGTARSNLGLGTVATTAATAYATAAQGTKADSALQDVVSDTSPQLGGNLDVQARTLTTSTSNGNVVVDPPGTGFLQVEGTTNPGKIRLMCEAGTHGVGLISPAHSTGANYDLVLPTATGSANQALKTDGSGNLGWSTLGTSAAADTGTGSANVILGNDSRLTDDRDPNAHSAALVTSGTLAAARGGTGVASIPMVGVISAADAGAARTVLGLGTAAIVNTGTSAGNLVVLDGSAKLPAVDGSQLTNVSGGGSTDWKLDIAATDYVRLFDDFLGAATGDASDAGGGGSTKFGMLAGSQGYWDTWMHASTFENAGYDLRGFIRGRCTAGSYKRAMFTVPQVLANSPSDGAEAMVEFRLQHDLKAWNAATDGAAKETHFWVSAFRADNNNTTGTTEGASGYGDTAKVGIEGRPSQTYYRGYVYNNAGTNGSVSFTNTSVSATQNAFRRIGVHYQYVAASTKWVVKMFIEGSQVYTADITTGTGSPYIQMGIYADREATADSLVLVDYATLQYTSPTIAWKNITAV